MVYFSSSLSFRPASGTQAQSFLTAEQALARFVLKIAADLLQVFPKSLIWLKATAQALRFSPQFLRSAHTKGVPFAFYLTSLLSVRA